MEDKFDARCGVCNKLVENWDAHEQETEHKQKCRERLMKMMQEEKEPAMKRLLFEMAYEKV